MKKLTAAFAIIGFILVLAGCNSAYKSHIEAGEEAIHNKDYTAALGHYANAIEEKETDEAVYVHGILEVVIAGLEAYDQEDYEQSISHFHDVMKADEEKAEITATIKKDIGSYLKDAELALETYNSMNELLEQGRESLNAGDYDAAIDSFEQAAAMGADIESEKVQKLIMEAEDLLMQAEAAKEAAGQPAGEGNVSGGSRGTGTGTSPGTGTGTEDNTEENQEPVEDEAVEGESENAPDDSTETVSIEEAEEYVLEFLRQYYDSGVSDDVNISFDHANGEGHYVFQVYEIAGDGGETRTSTLGWYAVNPEDAQVYDAMN